MGVLTRKGNCPVALRVYHVVKFACCWLIAGIFLVASVTAFDYYASVKHKFDLIEAGSLRAGTRVELSAAELNAYAAREVPPGVRNPQLQLAPATATATAMIDFGKLRRAQGYQPGWLMSKLLDGEHPVSVTARIRSNGGKTTVDVDRVSISGIEIDGRTLDFLIQNFLLVLYPNAMVGRPFEMGHRIDRLEVARTGVAVVIGR
jgi:hypothetical protein